MRRLNKMYFVKSICLLTSLQCIIAENKSIWYFFYINTFLSSFFLLTNVLAVLIFQISKTLIQTFSQFFRYNYKSQNRL